MSVLDDLSKPDPLNLWKIRQQLIKFVWEFDKPGVNISELKIKYMEMLSDGEKGTGTIS